MSTRSRSRPSTSSGSSSSKPKPKSKTKTKSKSNPKTSSSDFSYSRTVDVNGKCRWYKVSSDGKRTPTKDPEYLEILKKFPTAQRDKTPKGTSIFYYIDPRSGKKVKIPRPKISYTTIHSAPKTKPSSSTSAKSTTTTTIGRNSRGMRDDDDEDDDNGDNSRRRRNDDHRQTTEEPKTVFSKMSKTTLFELMGKAYPSKLDCKGMTKHQMAILLELKDEQVPRQDDSYIGGSSESIIGADNNNSSSNNRVRFNRHDEDDGGGGGGGYDDDDNVTGADRRGGDTTDDDGEYIIRRRHHRRQQQHQPPSSLSPLPSSFRPKPKPSSSILRRRGRYDDDSDVAAAAAAAEEDEEEEYADDYKDDDDRHHRRHYNKNHQTQTHQQRRRQQQYDDETYDDEDDDAGDYQPRRGGRRDLLPSPPRGRGRDRERERETSRRINDNADGGDADVKSVQMTERQQWRAIDRLNLTPTAYVKLDPHATRDGAYPEYDPIGRQLVLQLELHNYSDLLNLNLGKDDDDILYLQVYLNDDSGNLRAKAYPRKRAKLLGNFIMSCAVDPHDSTVRRYDLQKNNKVEPCYPEDVDTLCSMLKCTELHDNVQRYIDDVRQDVHVQVGGDVVVPELNKRHCRPLIQFRIPVEWQHRLQWSGISDFAVYVEEDGMSSSPIDWDNLQVHQL